MLPPAADFTFDLPIRGTGWHVREAGARGWYCWMGEQAALKLALTSGGDHRLRLNVEYAAGPEAWRGLEVRVNGHPVTLTREQPVPPSAVVAEVPGRLLSVSPEIVEIDLRVPRTVCPSDADRDNPDSRQLGLALSRVRLQPCPSRN
jgi:hypothetical protein